MPLINMSPDDKKYFARANQTATRKYRLDKQYQCPECNTISLLFEDEKTKVVCSRCELNKFYDDSPFTKLR